MCIMASSDFVNNSAPLYSRMFHTYDFTILQFECRALAQHIDPVFDKPVFSGGLDTAHHQSTRRNIVTR